MVKPNLNLGCGSDMRGEIRMDISPTMGINLLADAHHLPFRDKTIGNILCKSVLEHLESPFRAFLEMKRVTTGFIIISIPNIMNLKRILRTLRNPLYKIPPGTAHLQGWDSKEIRHLAYLSGLVVSSISWDKHLLFSSHMYVKLFEGESQG